MPKVHVRPTTSADIPHLIQIDASYTTEGLWRPEMPSGVGFIGVRFRETRLPRSVRVAYPRSLKSLLETWSHLDALLVAVVDEQVVGFIALLRLSGTQNGWGRDLVVASNYRRQGIGSALVLAGLQWAQAVRYSILTLEMQPRNLPAIRLAQKLGFVFSGYHEHYYAPQESALFFSRGV